MTDVAPAFLQYGALGATTLVSLVAVWFGWKRLNAVTDAFTSYLERANERAVEQARSQTETNVAVANSLTRIERGQEQMTQLLIRHEERAEQRYRDLTRRGA